MLSNNNNMKTAAVIAMGISIACNLEAAAIMLEHAKDEKEEEEEDEEEERSETDKEEDEMVKQKPNNEKGKKEEEEEDHEEVSETDKEEQQQTDNIEKEKTFKQEITDMLDEEEMLIDELMLPAEEEEEILVDNNAKPNLKRMLAEDRANERLKNDWVKIQRDIKDDNVNIPSLLKKYKLYDIDSAEPILLMNEENFLEILGYLKRNIKRSDTYMRKCIPVEVKLAVTLSFLTSGLSFKDLTKISSLSLGYLSTAIIEVCHAIYGNMRHTFLKFPDTKEKWLKVANDFEEHWDFPLCLGALGSKHFFFKAGKDRANLFYSERGCHSIILLALADAYEKFLYIDVGYPGRMSDDEVLSQSDLGQILINDNSLPARKIIGNNRKLPYVIVAGNSFPNEKHILTPYTAAKLVTKEAIYNSRLNSAKHNVKSALGILLHRFKILQTRILLDDVKTTIIVQACCVLHNFLIEKNAWYADFGYDEIIKPDYNKPYPYNTSAKAEKIRNEFREYFCAEGIIKNL